MMPLFSVIVDPNRRDPDTLTVEMHGVRRPIVGFVVLVCRGLLAFGCTSFGSAGSGPATTADAGAPDGKSGRFCDEHGPPTFCSDFDTASDDLTQLGWALSLTPGATVSIDRTQFLSPPRSFRSRFEVTPGSVLARIDRQIPRPFRRTRVAFSVMMPITPPVADGQHIAVAELVCWTEGQTNYTGAWVQWRRESGEPRLVVISNDQILHVTDVTAASRWTRIDLDVTWSGTPSAVLRIDDRAPQIFGVPIDCTKPDFDQMHLLLGLATFAGPPTEAFYDDVLVDVGD